MLARGGVCHPSSLSPPPPLSLSLRFLLTGRCALTRDASREISHVFSPHSPCSSPIPSLCFLALLSLSPTHTHIHTLYARSLSLCVCALAAFALSLFFEEPPSCHVSFFPFPEYRKPEETQTCKIEVLADGPVVYQVCVSVCLRVYVHVRVCVWACVCFCVFVLACLSMFVGVGVGVGVGVCMYISA